MVREFDVACAPGAAFDVACGGAAGKVLLLLVALARS